MRVKANCMSSMANGTGIIFRRETNDDVATIARHRYEMFRDMGYSDEEALASMRNKFERWVEPKLKSGDYLAWFAATEAGAVVAGAGLWLMDWPPHMVGSSVRRGNIVNVYTEPEFRRRGLARRLVESALEWCKTNHIDFVILHASPQGRSLYEELGFQSGNEMRIKL